MLLSKDANNYDAVVAGQNATGNLRWSLAARRHVGDDLPNLDREPQWDFDPAFYDTVNYTTIGGLNPTSASAIAAVRAKYTEAQLAPYFTVTTDAAGNWTAIKVTPEGVARARALDKSGYDQTVGGQKIGPGSPVDDWMVDFKVSTSNTIFGLQRWRTRESGSVPLVDNFAASGRNGFLWTPEHLSVYMKNFARYLDDKLQMQLSTQFNQHSLDGTDSNNVFLQSYQLGNLQVNDLVAGQAPRWNPQYNYRLNNRLRSELNLFYEHSERFNVVGGVEARYSSIGAINITSATAPADETGAPPTGVLGGNQIGSRDLGFYAQASWRLRPSLKLVGGGRFDNNKIRQNGGFGTVFNPRLAGVFTRQEESLQGDVRGGVPGRAELPEVPDRARRARAVEPGTEAGKGQELRGVRILGSAADDRRFSSWPIDRVTAGSCRRCRAFPAPESPDARRRTSSRTSARLAINGFQAEARWTLDVIPAPGQLHVHQPARIRIAISGSATSPATASTSSAARASSRIASTPNCGSTASSAERPAPGRR